MALVLLLVVVVVVVFVMEPWWWACTVLSFPSLHPTLVEIKWDLLVSLLLGLVSFGCVCSDNVHVVGDRQRMKVTRNKDGIE